MSDAIAGKEKNNNIKTIIKPNEICFFLIINFHLLDSWFVSCFLVKNIHIIPDIVYHDYQKEFK